MNKSKMIKFGSKEHEALIAGAYSMTKAMAEKTIADFEKNPAAVQFKDVEKARAMLDALKAEPIAIDPAPGHFRKPNRFVADDADEA